MSGNMITRLGYDWFNDRCTGAHFLYKGKIYVVLGATALGVVAQEYGAGNEIKLSHEYFSGFKVFEHPPLGYRKLGNGFAMYLTRRNTYQRGLRSDTVKLEHSPVTELVRRKFTGKLGLMLVADKMRAVFNPEFDSVDKLHDLFAAKLPCVVLSADVLVEYNVFNTKARGWVVYFKRQPVCNIDPKRRMRWHSEEYKAALSHLFKEFINE